MDIKQTLVVAWLMWRLARAKTPRKAADLRRRLVAMGPAVVGALKDYTHRSDERYREAAVAVLREIRAAPPREILTRMLKSDPSDAIRYKVAEALSKHPGEETIIALLGALDDRSFRVRFCACAALHAVTGDGLPHEDGGIDSFVSGEHIMLDAEDIKRNVDYWHHWYAERSGQAEVQP
jgi:hypothetical protein